MKIDRYEIKRELGRGGMAIVYVAFDPRIEREVAVKVMHGRFLEEKVFRERFNQEVRAVATLEHSNIVPIYDYGDFEGRPFLVMRYMRGGSLAARLNKGAIPLEQALIIISRVGQALDAAHRRGIVHRDIKPANILLDRNGNAFLSDFGVVKMGNSRITPLDELSVRGTPAYASPEQLKGEQAIDGRADIYSLGAMLFEMLAGHKPFESENAISMVYKHLTQPAPSIHKIRPDLPEQLDSVIAHAMAKDPKERYDTAKAMTKDLTAATGIDAPRLIEVARRTTQGRGRVEDEDTPDTQFVGTNKLRPRRKALMITTLAAVGALVIMLAMSAAGGLNPPANATRTPDLSGLGPTPVILGGGSGLIAFASDVADIRDIFLMSADGSGITRLLADPISKAEPRWSPDGTMLVFQSVVNNMRVLYTVQQDGARLKPLTSPNYASYSGAWSPDGKQIVFVSERDGNAEIYMMNADGTDQTRLTDNPALDFAPSWSPDGKHIVFYSGRDRNFNVYVMDPDGSRQTALTDSGASDYDPSWSPDGSKIAFVSERDGNAEIYVMDTDGTDQIRLTNNSSGDVTPVWSPDGSLIAFVSRRDGNAEIYRMNADGSNEVRLTTDPADDLDPAWQP